MCLEKLRVKFVFVKQNSGGVRIPKSGPSLQQRNKFTHICIHVAVVLDRDVNIHTSIETHTNMVSLFLQLILT